MKEQLFNILEKLIIKNNIRVNKEELKLQLSSHPSYPSLHALTGVLDHFSVTNLALRLSVNKEILKQLPDVFIANIVTDNGEDLVLTEKKKGKIKITVDTNKTELIEEGTFLSRWNGIIVAIEKDKNNKGVKTNDYSNVLKWVLAFSGFLCIGYFVISQTNVFAQSHFILSSIGLVLSVIIVKHELGIQSNTTNQFCNLSEKTSCDAVLNSKGATIFGMFKLSDISLITFLSYCLCWILFFINKTSDFSILSLVTLSTLPFIAYSLYYQYQIVKKWCPLCLGIASVLALQFTVLLCSNISIKLLTFNVQTVLLFLLSVIVTISTWSILKDVLKKKKSLEKIEIEYYKFKRKFSLFKSIYSESDTLSVINYFPGELVLGNKNASTELIIVTSPLCFFCKKAHRDIGYLLDQLQDKIKVIVRFNVDISNKNDLLYKVASRLLDIYNVHGEKAALKSLKEVYSEDVNLQEWINNQAHIVTKPYDDILDEQSKWCKVNTINFTPALYLNNTLFPQEYDRIDLVYFIDDLTELPNISNNAIAS